MGMRASETTELIFQDCRVHRSQVLGEVGEGFIQSLKVLDGGRISIAALSLGIAKGAYEAALQYSKERTQFNQPISSFQGIAFKLADMATEIAACELLINQACDLKNKGLPVTKEAAMAKVYSSRVAEKISSKAIELFGGYGYVKDYPVEKFWRDSKIGAIYEGTSNMQLATIAKLITSGK